uniref:Uncharacterized protein n=1 Tax=Candidatus Kentrum sp. DK TaxID=2126562 RepID=A0A450SH30_9GAMM|nr:MAG: hypothetical protein BECKDK2373C_GA0170839_103620 [Candidatus Kentron sp. DK]
MGRIKRLAWDDIALWTIRGIFFLLGVGIVAAVLSVVLFSLWPNIATWWGDEQPVYISLDSCEAPDDSVSPEAMENEARYSAKTFLSLDKALRLSDAIALLAVLVAMVTLMLPVFGYLSIVFQRKSIDKEMDSKFGDLNSKQKALISASLATLNAYPALLSLANRAADKYSIDLIKEIDSEASGDIDDVKGRIQEFVRDSLISDRIRSALTNLLEESDDSFLQGLDIIGSYIEKSDDISSGAFIPELKIYLYMLCEKGYVNTNAKEQEFKRFLKDKLHREIDVFRSEQAS